MAVAAAGAGGCCPTAMSLAVQAITGRWFMVYATILIMAMAGAAYIFGTYSNDIKSSLGYDQTTLNLLSFFKDVGTTVGVPSGLLMEVTPPWVVLASGGVLNFFGYFMIWLAVTGRIAKPAVWQMCLYICIGANSQAFANTAAMVTCVKNFPESRGIVIGLLKGFMGLSGAIITEFYHAIYVNNSKALILLIGWLPTIVSAVFIRTIRPMKPVSNPNEVKVFYQLLYMSLALAGFIMAMIITQTRVHFSQHGYVGRAVVVVLLLCLPLYIVFRQEVKLWKEKQYYKQEAVATPASDSQISVDVNISHASDSQISVDVNKTPASETDGCFQNVFRPPDRGEDYTILQALFSIDMHILFLATICGVGGTLTAIDNLGQIGTSLGYPKRSISTFVSLVSIWNYLGRVTSGFLSEHFLSKYKLPRPLMLTFVLLLSCLGHLLIAFGVPNGLYLASVVTGFCYGAQWPLIFAIISEIFGLKYYSTLFNFGTVASPIGAYIMNVIVTGRLYDREAERQMAALGLSRKPGKELNCDGVRCYRLAFLIITAVTVFGVFVSSVLAVRTRNFYRSDIYKKFREGGKVVESMVVVADGGGTVAVEAKGGECKEGKSAN